MADSPVDTLRAAIVYAKDAPRDKDGSLAKASLAKLRALLNHAKNAIPKKDTKSLFRLRSKSLSKKDDKASLIAEVLAWAFGEDAEDIFNPRKAKKPGTTKSLFYLGFPRYKDLALQIPEVQPAWHSFRTGFKHAGSPMLPAPTVKPSTAPAVAKTPQTEQSHPTDVPFKGPSGRWFVLRSSDHRVVPSPGPEGAEPAEHTLQRGQASSVRKRRQEEKQNLKEVEDYVSAIKGGKDLSHFQRVRMAASLFLMTSDQLKELMEKHGIEADSDVKESLVRKINEQMGKNTPPKVETEPEEELVEDVSEEEPETEEQEEEAPEEEESEPEPEPEPERGSGSGPDVEGTEGAGERVEGEAEGSSDAGADQAGEAPGEPPGKEAAQRVPASREEVNRRLDRYEKLFRSRGHHEQADWMGMLRSHVNEVGTDEALASLGAEAATKGGSDQDVLYEGGVGWEDMSGFMQSYLNRHGIVSVHQGQTLTPDQRSVSSLTAQETEEEGRSEERDFKPQDPGWGVNKLKEAQHLPGLEKSEDLSKIMGGEFGGAVTHFTPEVISKLDETYGKDGWIVKPYDDEGFAGRGIFFPQYIQGLAQNARNVLWTSGSNLSNYGFSHLRDEDGRVVGIKHSNGDEYEFGTEKYGNTIQGDARKWADEAEAVAGNEKVAELPFGGKGFMAQPAFPVVGISEEERAQGVTIKKGAEGRTHIITRNGKAEWIPHSTWMKKESLPVVFENDDTRAMAQAAIDAINALPESERSGQTYAPDIVKTKDGFKVIEANPSAKGGGSGYLEDNPFIIDSYVSSITGREPAHVQFVRKLLTKKGEKRDEGKQGKTDSAGEAGQGRGRGGPGRSEGVRGDDTGRAPSIDPKEPEKGTDPKGVSKQLGTLGVGSLPASDSDEGRWDHPKEVQDKYNASVLEAAKKGKLFIPPESLARVTKSPNVGGQEHDVHEDAENNKFYKFTKGGRFGQNKDVHEYLERNEVANELWPSLGYKFHGITQSPFDGTPQVVMSMNRIEGTHPEQQEIHDWFEQNGWEPHGERSSSPDDEDLGQWEWRDPKTGTIIGDTHTKNFIKTAGGLVPIDVDILPGKNRGEKGYYRIGMKSLNMHRIGKSSLMNKYIKKMEAARRTGTKVKAQREVVYTLHWNRRDGKPINGWKFSNYNTANNAADTFLMENGESDVGVYIEGTDGTDEFYGRD